MVFLIHTYMFCNLQLFSVILSNFSGEMSDIPEGAPEHCPGTKSEEAGKAAPCAGCPNQAVCSSGALKDAQPDPDMDGIRDRMSSVKHKIIVLSGKGGVGKSTFSSVMARALALNDKKCQVGLLDIDICGPSQPRMMGAEKEMVHQSMSGWSPVFIEDNLCVMSIGFLVKGRDDAVIWRGPRKNGMIKQFLKDVDWGELDFLIIDTPPGTSDEHISIVQFLLHTTGVDGAVLVTSPQEVSLLDVRKEASFCRKVGLPILGVVENMSGFVCPHCSTSSDIFPSSTGGADKMCDDMNLNLLAKIPLDPRIAQACDRGENVLTTYPESRVAEQFLHIAEMVRVRCIT